MTVVLVLGGLLALLAGGEVLVRGASSLARSLGMSPLVVGLTIVAFATSAPEMAVTVDAALAGNPGIALGNVVGSNIVNVLLILGATALIVPLAVASQLVRIDIPVLIALSTLSLVLALDGTISRADGALLVGVALAYLALAVVVGRRSARDQAGARDRSGPSARHLGRDVLLILLGVALLVVGARALVDGASDVARAWGVSDLVIGLTVVAAGTSLPELVTSVVAALRKEPGMAVGNIAGSCILNLSAVLGAAGLLAPRGVPVQGSAIAVDLPFMLAVAAVLLPLAFTGRAISRWEGAVLVVYYGAYTTYLLLEAGSSAAVGPFSAAMLLLVVPLTAVWIAAASIGEVRRRATTDVQQSGPSAQERVGPAAKER